MQQPFLVPWLRVFIRLNQSQIDAFQGVPSKDDIAPDGRSCSISLCAYALRMKDERRKDIVTKQSAVTVFILFHHTNNRSNLGLSCPNVLMSQSSKQASKQFISEMSWGSATSMMCPCPELLGTWAGTVPQASYARAVSTTVIPFVLDDFAFRRDLALKVLNSQSVVVLLVQCCWSCWAARFGHPSTLDHS